MDTREVVAPRLAKIHTHTHIHTHKHTPHSRTTTAMSCRVRTIHICVGVPIRSNVHRGIAEGVLQPLRGLPEGHHVGEWPQRVVACWSGVCMMYAPCRGERARIQRVVVVGGVRGMRAKAQRRAKGGLVVVYQLMPHAQRGFLWHGRARRVANRSGTSARRGASTGVDKREQALTCWRMMYMRVRSHPSSSFRRDGERRRRGHTYRE